MAYYAWDAAREPVEPITAPPGTAPSGIGAYYAWDSAHEPVVPVNGLSGSAEAKLSDEALRALIDRRRPLAVVGEWARQVTDLEWAEAPDATALTLLPLTDADLNRARRAAFGAEAPAVGVIGRAPKARADQALAFVGTPYALGLSLAVYSLADTARVARPLFLTLATLRDVDDADRGTRSVERAAAKLERRLVYVVSLPKTAKQRGPGAPFREVFRAMGAAPAAPVTESKPSASVTASLPLGLYFIGGALAIGGVWWALAQWETS
jgi:hypothetical protein